MSGSVVIPVRDGRRPTPDYLTWTLRSIDKNLPHTNVVLVGALPKWVDPAAVTHVPTLQGVHKFVNIGVNLQAALDHPDVTDQFTWFNDDMYILRPVDQVPLMHRETIGAFCERLNTHRHRAAHSTDHVAFVKGMQSQRWILRKWGFTDDEPCTDMHTPIPIDKARCVDVLARAQQTAPEHQLGHFRALYGAGLPSQHLKDPKPSRKDFRVTDETYLSTYVSTWKDGLVGQHIRALFPTPSKYEKKGKQ